MIERLIACWVFIQRLFLSDKYELFLSSATRLQKEQASSVRQNIDNSSFWEGLKDLVTIATPVVKMLNAYNTNHPVTGKVYALTQNAVSTIARSEMSFFSAARQTKLTAIVQFRSRAIMSDFYIAAHLLDPVNAELPETAIKAGWINSLMAVCKLIVKDKVKDLHQSHDDLKTFLDEY
ncbi:hypothetical protein RCL1_002708 [Eukaryota sp. TZLM3-RCL]